MNTYIVAFADIAEEECWVKKFTATGFKECVSKIAQYINDEYDVEISDNYHEMINDLKDNDLIISTITDLDEL